MALDLFNSKRLSKLQNELALLQNALDEKRDRIFELEAKLEMYKRLADDFHSKYRQESQAVDKLLENITELQRTLDGMAVTKTL